MEFKDEAGAAIAAKELMAHAERAKMAVAFWGHSAVKTLGLDRKGLNLSVLCNLDSGACNPKEIRRLQSVCGDENVKSLSRLHAKVYWTPHGALLGSSNASANGLAVEGAQSQSWAEANLLIRDRKNLKDLEDWFDLRWNEGKAIKESDLKRAEQLWNKRKSAAPSAKPLTSDIIHAYRDDPANPGWKKVRFIFWSEKLSKTGEAEFNQEQKAQPFLKDYDCYEDWKEIEADEQIVEFKIETNGADFSGYFKCPQQKIETKTLTWVLPANAISLPGTAMLGISKPDQAFIKGHTVELLKSFSKRRKGWAHVDIATFVSAMDTLGHPQTPLYSKDNATFRALLLETARIGQAHGLRMPKFRSMITKLGGLGTARALLNSPVEQSGLTGLWEKRLMDISVEALALQPQWQREFTPKQVSTAKRRLKKHELAVDGAGSLMQILSDGRRRPYASART